MTYYFVPLYIVEESKIKAEATSLSMPEKYGYIRLYEDNGWTTTYLKLHSKHYTKLGFIVSSDEPIPEYWSKVVVEVEFEKHDV
jgi:hypothetical protein